MVTRMVVVVAALAATPSPAGAQAVTATATWGSYYASAAGRTQSSPGGPHGGQASATGFAGFSCTVNATAIGSVQGAALQLRAETGIFSPLGEQCVTSMFASASTIVRLVASRPVAGVLQIRAAGDASLDVGNDGRFEVSGNPVPPATVIPVVVDAAGLEILAHAATFSPSSLPFRSSLDVTFVATPGVLHTALPACGTSVHGHAVVDAVRGLSLRLVATPATPTPHSFFVLGTAAAPVSIPPRGCLFGVTPLAAVAVPVAASGRAVWAIGLPAPLPSATVFCQHLLGTVAPAGTVWEISNRIELRLP